MSPVSVQKEAGKARTRGLPAALVHLNDAGSAGMRGSVCEEARCISEPPASLGHHDFRNHPAHQG